MHESISRYCQLTTLEVQEWLNKIEQEIRDEREHEEEENSKLEDSYWMLDFTTSRTRNTC